MAEIYCRQQPENPKDWEKKRWATVKRLNKVNVKGRCVQPQGWTLQHYLLEWHEPEWTHDPCCRLEYLSVQTPASGTCIGR